jgi:hypothetical protein
MIGADLRRKGVDPNRSLEFSLKKRDISSLDMSLDLCDFIGRYRCKYCNYEWEEKPPPGFKSIRHLPPTEKDRPK